MTDERRERSSPSIAETPRVGVDEWVAQVDERTQHTAGFWGRLAIAWGAIPLQIRYAGVLLLALFFPALVGSEIMLDLLGISDNAFILRTAVRFLTFAILAIGLNVVVGYAGLLDLGYIAFMGIAGYLYAYLSSEFVRIGDFIPYGLAIPSIVSVPLIVLAVAGIGWLIGSASLRLAGDYLAIVTLGFGIVFIQVSLTATRLRLPWVDHPVDLTRGPNGINRLDDISIFGFTFDTTLKYYYLLLFLLVLVYAVVSNINLSRIGRSWRSLREDELAAEVMGMPTRGLKLLAFSIGAGIAGLAGAVDAAFQGNVVPNPRYSVLTLITLYAMVVLGGTGSLPGALIGAFIFTVIPELLRNVVLAGLLFYAAGLMGLFFLLRPLRRFLLVMGGTVAAGYLFKFVINLVWPGWDTGYPPAGSVLNEFVQGWLVIPENYKLAGNIAIWACIFVLLLAVLAKERPVLHYPLLGIAVYLAVFSWETRLALEPSATRILIVGLTLVCLMIFRPQGLLGEAQVKVV